MYDYISAICMNNRINQVTIFLQTKNNQISYSVYLKSAQTKLLISILNVITTLKFYKFWRITFKIKIFKL